MTYIAILTASLVLLLAFGVERLGRLTGVPSVVTLLLTGMLAKPVLASFGWTLTGLDAVVPMIGTIGLVLIVLEGAFDLELRREKLPLAGRALLLAMLGFGAWSGLLTGLGMVWLSLSAFDALVLAVPFAVISSAVAIPSSAFLPERGREFVVYESSISDIVGILVFFALLGSDGTLSSFLSVLGGGGLVSLVLGALSAVTLLVVLLRLDGHIRFIPLLAGLFALYAAAKLWHLSPLVMVLMFGLVLNNPSMLSRFQVMRPIFATESYVATISEFKSLTAELTFAVRAFFFMLLGYWTDLDSLLTVQAWVGTGLVLVLVFGVRAVLVRVLKVEYAAALLWVAPRGLITVLLYLNAKEVVSVPSYVDGVVMLLVLLSAVLVGVGRFRLQKVGTM